MDKSGDPEGPPHIARAGLIEALVLLKSGKHAGAARVINRTVRRMSPGGRRLLRELEKRRAGLFALEQLRRVSGDYALIYKQVIALELQSGDATRAFEAIQQFSARALLRRSGAAPLGKAVTALDGDASLTGELDPGAWAMRRLLLRGKPSGTETLGWRKTVSVLRKLGSD